MGKGGLSFRSWMHRNRRQERSLLGLGGQIVQSALYTNYLAGLSILSCVSWIHALNLTFGPVFVAAKIESRVKSFTRESEAQLTLLQLTSAQNKHLDNLRRRFRHIFLGHQGFAGAATGRALLADERRSGLKQLSRSPLDKVHSHSDISPNYPQSLTLHHHSICRRVYAHYSASPEGSVNPNRNPNLPPGLPEPHPPALAKPGRPRRPTITLPSSSQTNSTTPVSRLS